MFLNYSECKKEKSGENLYFPVFHFISFRSMIINIAVVVDNVRFVRLQMSLYFYLVRKCEEIFFFN